MLLEVEQLDVRYGRNHAVKSLNLNLPENGIVTVLGANGAGKSSLLKAIMGIVPVAAGAIRFAGANITNTSVPRRTRQGLVLVPEGRQILTSLTVHENLLMGAYQRKHFDLAETDAIYDRFANLAQRRDMQASVLSGGEQQMLAIGRALLAKPRLMMLDEPSLDTHMALQIAHYGYVLELGTISLEGKPAQLQDDEDLRAAYLGNLTEGISSNNQKTKEKLYEKT